MKFRVFANATLLGLILMPLANAQLLTYGLQGNIPFEFRVGDSTFPAGKYSFSRNMTGQKIVLMRDLNYKSAGAAFSANQVEARRSVSSETPTLVFHRYGKTYFLSQLWQGFGEPGAQLQQSKAERTIAHQMATLRKPDTVEIALSSFPPTDAGN
jgi:hypothetical protein